MKKVILILVLFLMAIWTSEVVAQAPSSESPAFTNPWVEALRYGTECVAIDQKGYDCECVSIVRKMVRGGEVTKAKGDLLIILGCKKAPKSAPGNQGVTTHECINGHVWQSTGFQWICPWCRLPGWEVGK